MKKTVIAGISVLAVVWLWLAWLLLRTGGINLKNLLLLAMTAVIIFMPLYKKYIQGEKEDKK